MPGQVVGERGGGSQHPEQPVAQRLGRGERVEEGAPLPGVEGLDEPYEGGERLVGVGGGAQRVEQDRVAAHRGELLAAQQRLGGHGVAEAVPQQPPEPGVPSPFQHAACLSRCSRPA